MPSSSLDPARSKCPKCGLNAFRRSRRSRLEKAFAALPYLPYRCLDCQARFWRRVPKVPPDHRPARVSGAESRRRKRVSSRRQFIVYSLALLLLFVLTAFFTRDRE
jgi:DNA-directed RNA polymerase subunit RPC12/RpoP